MSLYGALLFLHVAAALALCAALFGEYLAFALVRDASTAGGSERAFATLARSHRLGMVGMVTLLPSGGVLMRLVWGPVPWLLVAFALLLVLPLLGGLTLRCLRAIRRLAKDEQAEGELAARRLLNGPLLRQSLRVRSVVVLGIVFLMTVKPGLDTALLAALVVTALSLGVLWWERRT